MMWATNSGIGFFGGFDRLPLPPGKKGCALGLVIVAGLVSVALALAYLFGFAGVIAFVVVAFVLSWRLVSKLGKENRARAAALQQELRDAAAESDTEFRVR